MAPMTVEQLEARSDWIGSSDVPALLGVGYEDRNIGSVYLEKTKQIEFKPTETEETEWGERLEPLGCDWLRDHFGFNVERGHTMQSEGGIFRAQLDGWIPEFGETVEVKSSGLTNPMFRPLDEGWGPELDADGKRTDAVPYKVLAQVQFALMVSGAPRCHVIAFLGGGAWRRYYVVKALPELQAEIRRRAMEFWHGNVKKLVPPDEVPTIETLKTVKRVPGRVVDIAPELVERLKSARDMKALAAAAEESVAAEVMHAVGNAEEGISIAGHVTLKADKNGKRSLRLVKGPK